MYLTKTEADYGENYDYTNDEILIEAAMKRVEQILRRTATNYSNKNNKPPVLTFLVVSSIILLKISLTKTYFYHTKTLI